MQCPLQAIYGAGLAVSLGCDAVKGFSLIGQLLLYVGKPLGKALARRSFVHGENLPVLHCLSRRVKLLPRLSLTSGQIVALLCPILLGEICTAAKCLNLVVLALRLLGQLLCQPRQAVL